MKQTEYRVRTRTGDYDIEARVLLVGEDLLVAISGGEKPHIGAVAMAQPRPSLKDPAVTSATASVFSLLGHKEDDLAKATAEILAAQLNTNVVVTAGVHWDDLSKEGIQRVVENSKLLIELILAEVLRNLYPAPE